MNRSISSREVLLLVIVVAIACAILVPALRRHQARQRLEACEANLKQIAAAVEQYSTDNSGRDPFPLSSVAPRYLKRVPTCPAAGVDTYSAMYACLS
jgi:type II secretory pathway pseudopilin PulG